MIAILSNVYRGIAPLFFGLCLFRAGRTRFPRLIRAQQDTFRKRQATCLFSKKKQDKRAHPEATRRIETIHICVKEQGKTKAMIKRTRTVCLILRNTRPYRWQGKKERPARNLEHSQQSYARRKAAEKHVEDSVKTVSIWKQHCF